MPGNQMPPQVRDDFDGCSPQGDVRRDLEKTGRVLRQITPCVSPLFLREVKLASSMQPLRGMVQPAGDDSGQKTGKREPKWSHSSARRSESPASINDKTHADQQDAALPLKPNGPLVVSTTPAAGRRPFRRAMPRQVPSPPRIAARTVTAIRRRTHHKVQGIAKQYGNVPEPITERWNITVNMKGRGAKPRVLLICPPSCTNRSGLARGVAAIAGPCWPTPRAERERGRVCGGRRH